MTTSVHQLKLHVQVVSVQTCLWLISNFSLKDLGQVQQVWHWAVVTEDLGVQSWLLDQGFNKCFAWETLGTVPDSRLRMTIYRNTGRRMSVNSSRNLDYVSFWLCQLHCGIYLEVSIKIFSHSTPTHDDALPHQVRLQKVDQFRRYHPHKTQMHDQKDRYTEWHIWIQWFQYAPVHFVTCGITNYHWLQHFRDKKLSHDLSVHPN